MRQASFGQPVRPAGFNTTANCPDCGPMGGHMIGGGCGPGGCGPHGCTGHCGGCCGNLPCHPVHRNFYTYDVPRDGHFGGRELLYPPQNQQPAVVQYPYYTLRGPTDFFMK